MAQAFDTRRLALRGDAIRVAEHVGGFSASQRGQLVFGEGAPPGIRRLLWHNREGKPIQALGEAAELGEVILSTDGSKAAVEVTTAGNTDIWIYETESGRSMRFTFDAAAYRDPVWAPDGKSIVFRSNRGGKFDLYRKQTEGGAAEELLYADQLDKRLTSWSPDGRTLLHEPEGAADSSSDIWWLRVPPAHAGLARRSHCSKPATRTAGGFLT